MTYWRRAARLFRVWLALIRLHYELQLTGFNQVFSRYTAAYGSHLARPVRNWPQHAADWVWAIDVACRLVPWQARCLHRSFLGYRFLRKQVGVPVVMTIGVQKFPFSAHAWLTLNGRCVNEEPELVARYTVILQSKG